MKLKEYALSHQNTFCLELERVSMLLDKCGHPETGMKIIHVAGTNGKGSVCSFICEGLIFGGETVGRFSSPELFNITDTITVNSNPIKMNELEDIYSFLEPLCREVESELAKAPSQFEINFVAALVHFKNSGCTHGIIECGMGGIGDATNAMCDSDVCVITKISLDHQNFLGETTAEIAANKCGIFKKSSCVFTVGQSRDVMDVIKKSAGERLLTIAKSPCILGHDGFCEVVSFDNNEKIRLSLCGVHQAENAALAREVLLYLGFENCVKHALENAVNPARFEKIDTNVYFDGAHNPDGVKKLVETLNLCMDNKHKIIFVVGFMADKDYTEALSNLKNLKNSDFEIYTVTVHSNPRSESSQKLCMACTQLGFSAVSKENISEACFEAKQNADFVFAFGSLYMYKEYTKL